MNLYDLVFLMLNVDWLPVRSKPMVSSLEDHLRCVLSGLYGLFINVLP